MGVAVAEFSGADRRARAGAAPSSTPRSRLILATCGAAIAVLSFLPALSSVVHTSFPGDGWQLTSVSGALGLATIAAWLGAWALSGRTWPAYAGLAFVPVWVLAEVASTPVGTLSHRSSFSLVAVMVAATSAALLHRARRSPDIDTAWRPFPALGWLVASVLAVVLVVAVMARLGMHAPGLAVFALGAGAAAGWCVAAEICRRRFDIGTVDRRRMALALVSFAFAAGDRTTGRLRLAHDTTSWAFTCGRAVALVGWCLLLAVALRSLIDARAQNRRRQQQLRGARDEVVRGWADEQQRFDQRRHDTRSLVAGIQGATTTLTRYRDFLDPREQRELESALVGEIQRLAHAVSPGSAEPGHFTLEAAVGPVITAERARGTVVNSFLADVEVLGSADATAAVVQNLVTNARRHAPGSVITVAADVVGAEIRLVVDDDGPGLPAPVRQRVIALFAEGPAYRRSVPDPRSGDRANTAGGRRSGLGLAICARLAREQGGRLRLADTDVGTRIELLLPLVLGAEPGAARSDASR